MSAKIKFVIGRAGTGKTYNLYEGICECERLSRRSFLIVPERATFEAERELSLFCGGGLMHGAVVSWTSLARKTMAQAGERRAFLSSQGKRMLVRRAIDEVSSGLKAFSKVYMRTGFAGECDSIIARCKSCAITPDALTDAGERLPEGDVLRDKLHDFALIYERLELDMANRYIDSDDLLNFLIDRLPDSPCSGADIFIDAPAGEQEFRIISSLIANSASITFALRGDIGGYSRNEQLFSGDAGAYLRLKAMARAQGASMETIYLEHRKREAAAELIHLERNLFSFPYTVFPDTAAAIELNTSADRHSEVTAAAEAIRCAVRDGMRYRDIAVVVSDPEGYEPLIKRVFKTYDIPFFMDAPRPVIFHPASALVLRALSCAQSGFRSSDIIALIKTGLTGISRHDCELLENHILKHGLSGKKLTLEFSSEVLPKLEQARKTLMQPLVKLREAVSNADSKTRTEALFDYLNELRLNEQLSALCERFSKAGELAQARETAQVYETLMELLDQLYVILGDEKTGLHRYISIIEEGLKTYSVGIIPTTCDQAIVGDAERTKTRNLKFLLVLGMNDTLLPKLRMDCDIINDADLLRLKAAGLTVWDSSETKNCRELAELYTLLSKPTQRLRVSCALKTGVDSAAPSTVFLRLARLFPKAVQTDTFSRIAEYSTPETALASLAEGLRTMIDGGSDSSEDYERLYAFFAHSDRYAPIINALDEMYFENNSPALFGHELATELYGRSLKGSASRLEIFNQCPFRHFLQYGLTLKERDEHEELQTDRGTLFHDALDRFIKRFIEDSVDPSTLSREQVCSRIDDIFLALVEEHNGGILMESARMRAEAKRMLRVLYATAWAITRQLASGGFRPAASEVSFGGPGDVFPALRIDAPGGASFLLRGIVDRIDAYSDEGAEYFRIIDYKSGSVKFDISELAAGIRLQLPLYSAAMQATLSAQRKCTAAGFYYMHVSEPVADETDEKKLEQKLLAEFKLRGLSLKEPSVIRAAGDFGAGNYSQTLSGVRLLKNGEYSGMLADEARMRGVLEKAKTIAANTLNRIMMGSAKISPCLYNGVSACKLCAYLSICRFDTRIPSNRYRRIQRVDAEAFMDGSRTALEEGAEASEGTDTGSELFPGK